MFFFFSSFILSPFYSHQLDQGNLYNESGKRFTQTNDIFPLNALGYVFYFYIALVSSFNYNAYYTCTCRPMSMNIIIYLQYYMYSIVN